MKILIGSPIDADAVSELATRHDVAYLDLDKGEEANTLLKECEVLVFRSGIEISEEYLDLTIKRLEDELRHPRFQLVRQSKS